MFSNYENTFSQIIAKLEENAITYSKVQGMNSVVNAIINKFTKGELKVLMLNASHYGSGLNLQMATDVIIFHQLPSHLESQVIGRAQRLGRQHPLNAYYLYYEGEVVHQLEGASRINIYNETDAAGVVTINDKELQDHLAQYPTVTTLPVMEMAPLGMPRNEPIVDANGAGPSSAGAEPSNKKKKPARKTKKEKEKACPMQ